MNGLVLRVDDHLVHGQILYGWVQGWPADQVWLVSDRIANDTLENATYMELLSGVKLGGVLTISDAIKRFAGMAPVRERILLILETCEDLARMIRGGVHPDEAHLGNLAERQGCKHVSHDVALSPTDLNALNEVQSLGCTVTIRDLPSSKPIEVEKALEEKDK